MKKYLILIYLIFVNSIFSIEFPEQRRSENDAIPRPLDGEIVETNPPAFVWLPVKSAQYYEIKISGNDGFQLSARCQFNVFVSQNTMAAGTYHWTVTAFDKEDKKITTRRSYQFILNDKAVEFPYPNLELQIKNIPISHPRLIFKKEDLQRIQATLDNERMTAWHAVQQLAEESLELGLPEPPWYTGIEDYDSRRLEYRSYYHYIRPYIDEGLQALAISWLMTGEEKYAIAGKKLLLHLSSWPADGNTSSNLIGFDEPGLSLARCMHRAYDWLYDALTPEEREIVKQACIDRAKDTFERVYVKRPFLKRPGSSHDARLIGYLSEQALVLYNEVPDETFYQWLDFSLTSFYTVFPHWGGRDGGWAEGTGYAAAYNVRATTWIESCISALGLDLWQKPFFNKIRNYFIYCAHPNDEFWPFGDGAERGPRTQPSRAELLSELMRHYANRFDDPVCQWWVDQLPLVKGAMSNPVTSMILPKQVKGKAPAGLENAKVFRDIGWCAMHSDLSSPDDDVFFLFKSSPYGSYSHSHADQNSFYLSVGGHALAIPSGYYGPVYGAAHHAEWTRSSKANNTILVNGLGQTVRDFTATGSITAFKNTRNITYVCGDAAPAYSGKLDTYKRHVMFVRPGLFLVLDELEAPEASTFQWMLHSLEKMEINEQKNTVIIKREPACSIFSLYTGKNVSSFSQTNSFDTPFNQGSDPKFYQDVKNHFHLTVSNENPAKSLRIAAIIWAGKLNDIPEIEYMNNNGWQGARIDYDEGIAKVWFQSEKSKTVPDDLKSINIVDIKLPVIGIWCDKNGNIIETITEP